MLHVTSMIFSGNCAGKNTYVCLCELWSAYIAMFSPAREFVGAIQTVTLLLWRVRAEVAQLAVHNSDIENDFVEMQRVHCIPSGIQSRHRIASGHAITTA